MNLKEKHILNAIFLAIILIVIIEIFIINSEPTTPIIFEVIGINNSEEAGTIAQLHLECINYCNDKFFNGIQRLDLCYEQCRTLGCETN